MKREQDMSLSLPVLNSCWGQRFRVGLLYQTVVCVCVRVSARVSWRTVTFLLLCQDKHDIPIDTKDHWTRNCSRTCLFLTLALCKTSPLKVSHWKQRSKSQGRHILFFLSETVQTDTFWFPGIPLIFRDLSLSVGTESLMLVRPVIRENSQNRKKCGGFL